MLLRLDAGQPLTVLSPVWAALSGLLLSSAMRLDQRTLVLSGLLLLLVEPLMGGLWELVVGHTPIPTLPVNGEGVSPLAGSDRVGNILPYARQGSAAHRLVSALAHAGARWRQSGWPAVAFVVNLLFALAIGSVLGQALAGVIAGVVVLIVRLRWRSGLLALVAQAVYDMLLPWLMGMLVLGQMAEYGLRPYELGLLLALLYTIAHVACLAIAGGARLPAVLMLDAAQVAVLAILLQRQETAALWLYGLCLIGQLAAHPGLLAGGKTTDYLRRAAAYVVVGMIVAAIALAPTLTGV